MSSVVLLCGAGFMILTGFVFKLESYVAGGVALMWIGASVLAAV